MDPEDLRRVSEFVNSQRPLGEEIPDTYSAKFSINASKPVVFEIRADYRESMKILKEHGLRLLTFQEALVAIDKDPNLKEQLKGKRLYLDGRGSQLSEDYTFNDEGELTQGIGDMERTVYAWKSSRPLSLDVRTDNKASHYGRRFYLNAFNDPQRSASAVVGISVAPPPNR